MRRKPEEQEEKGVTINTEDFVRLTSFIKQKYGIDLINKQQLVQSRLALYVKQSGYDNFTAFLDAAFADRSGVEVANIINRLTTNHTYFNRESQHFEHLVKYFLPKKEKENLSHQLCIWSAGCSYGNEPYNVAMFIDDYFGFRKPAWDCKILATDISLNALEKAKKGIYSASSIKELPEAWQKKYFTRLPDGNYQVVPRIRQEVVFRYHNLMEPIAFKKTFDLILCRNVMIYFDEPTREHLSQRFYDNMNHDSFLYIGHTEIISNNKFERVVPAIYRKP